LSYNNWRPRTKALIWLTQFSAVLVTLLYLILSSPLKLNSDLSAIFDSPQDSPLASLNQRIEQQGVKSQIALVGANSLSAAIAAADQLAPQIASLAGIAKVKHIYADMPSMALIAQQNLPYKQLLLSDTFKTLLEASDAKATFEHQFSLLNQLANPSVALTIEHDQTLSLADYLSRSFLPSSGLNLDSQRLVARFEGKTYVLILFETLASGLNIKQSQDIVTQLDALELAPENELVFTGSIFYASEASKTGQFEMTLFSSLSLAIMLLLVFASYRHFNSLLSTLWVIGTSLVYGYCALSLAFDQVSIVALIFAITLIGISADYSFHGLSELRFNSVNKVSPLRNIERSLSLSYITTAAGYVVLLLAPFELFKQVALFTIAGLLGAYLTVTLLYPWLAYKPGASAAPLPPFLSWVNQSHQGFTRKVSLTKFMLPLSLVLLVGLLGLGRANDDVRSFYAVAEHIKDNENKVKSILAQRTELQYIVVEGDSVQAVLEREEQVVMQLNALQKAGALQHYSAITQWLPAIKTQQANLRLLKQAQQQGLFGSLDNMLGRDAVLSSPAQTQYLTPQRWFETALGGIFKGQWFDDQPQQVCTVIRLAGINNLAATKQPFTDLPKVHFVDKAGDISQQISQFRQSLVYILIAAMLAALAVFAQRFGLKTACYAVASPAIALIVALAISMLVQGNISIFNLIAGVLILALGLDYSVFYAEHGFEQTITLTTLMSALSSIAVFAILMLSSMPAIKSFGLTVFIGVCVVFILAPQVTKLGRLQQ